MTTVRLDDVIRHPGGLRKREPITTAHLHVSRFYQAIEEGRRRRLGWVERIAAAPSPFCVDGLVADFVLFGSRNCSPKTTAQVMETARVRRCQLRGLLP